MPVLLPNHTQVSIAPDATVRPVPLHQIRKDALHITMFGFLTPGTKESIDPLASPKAVAAWLRQCRRSMSLVASNR